MTSTTGSIRLVRNEEVDREIFALDREPISMRTYISLVIESLNKKRDIVFALVIPAETADEISGNDDISVETVRRGIVYLAECINMHRFTVSYSNPNIISVSRKNVADPIMKSHIKNIYYYTLRWSILSVQMDLKNKNIFKTLSRVLDDSPNAVQEFVQENPSALTSEWIGTEDDYLNNSVFHTYLEQSKILGDVFDPKKVSEGERKKEEKIFKIVICVFLCFIGVSFVGHILIQEMSVYSVSKHVFLSSFCGVLLFLNSRI